MKITLTGSINLAHIAQLKLSYLPCLPVKMSVLDHEYPESGTMCHVVCLSQIQIEQNSLVRFPEFGQA